MAAETTKPKVSLMKQKDTIGTDCQWEDEDTEGIICSHQELKET